MDRHDSMHRGISRGVLRHGWLPQLSNMARRFVSGSVRQFSRLRQFAPQCCHSSQGITRQIIEAQVELDKWEASQVLPHGYTQEMRSNCSREGLISDDASSAHSSTTVLSMTVTQAINSLGKHHTICSAGPCATTSRPSMSSSSTISGDLRSSDAWSSSSGMMDDFAAMRANGSKCSPTATDHRQIPSWEEGDMVGAWAPEEDESSTLLRLAISEEVIAGPSCQQTDVTEMDKSTNWTWAAEEHEESSILLRLAISEEVIAGPSCQQTDFNPSLEEDVVGTSTQYEDDDGFVATTGGARADHQADDAFGGRQSDGQKDPGGESSEDLEQNKPQANVSLVSCDASCSRELDSGHTEYAKTEELSASQQEIPSEENTSTLLRLVMSDEALAGTHRQEADFRLQFPEEVEGKDSKGLGFIKIPASPTPSVDNGTTGEDDINCSDKADTCVRRIKEDDAVITAGTGTDKTAETDGDGLHTSQTNSMAQLEQEYLPRNHAEDEKQEQNVTVRMLHKTTNAEVLQSGNYNCLPYSHIQEQNEVTPSEDLEMIPGNVISMVKSYIQAETPPVFQDGIDTDEVAWHVQWFLGMMRSYYGGQALNGRRTSTSEDLPVIPDTAQDMNNDQNTMSADIQPGYNSLNDDTLLKDTANGMEEVFDLPSKEIMEDIHDGLFDDSFEEEATFECERSPSTAVMDGAADALPKEDGTVDAVAFECPKSSSTTLLDDLADAIYEDDVEESNNKLTMCMEDAMRDLMDPGAGLSKYAGITPVMSQSFERAPEEIPLPGKYRLVHSISDPLLMGIKHDPPDRAEVALVLRGGTRSLQKLARPPSGYSWEKEMMRGSGPILTSPSPLSMSSSECDISLLSQGQQIPVTAASDTARDPTSQSKTHQDYGQESKEAKDSMAPEGSSPMSSR